MIDLILALLDRIALFILDFIHLFSRNESEGF
jgi:hypothetical protein